MSTGSGSGAVRRAWLVAMASERYEVKREIGATPGAVFALLRDPQGHVTIDSSGMLQSADGKSAESVGDTFVVHMDREALGDVPLGKYDVTVTITKYEPDELIEWSVGLAGQPPIGHLYGYQLAANGDGTVVTSYYDWAEADPQWKARVSFPVLNETALRATLGILARTVEQ